MLSGYIEEGATLTNIGLEDNTIEGMGYTGGVVGYTYVVPTGLTLKNSTINHNTAKNYDYIGGIAGYVNNSGVILDENSNLYLDGIEIITEANYVGGLFGYTNGKVKQQINTIKEIKVIGNSQVGGLVGRLSSGLIETIEANDLIEVEGTGDAIGGLVGDYGTINEVKFNTKVTKTTRSSSNWDSAGGLAGEYTTIKNVIGESTVTSPYTEYTGGIEGTGTYVTSAILEKGNSSSMTVGNGHNGTNIFYFNDYTASTPQGTLWPDTYKNDLQQYSQAIDTEYTNDYDSTGYIFGLIDGDTEIHIIPSKNTSTTTPLELPYNGGQHTVKVTKTGKYKLEVWGAQGGSTKSSSISSTGGYGSYSVGYINLEKNNLLYVIVGGQGNGLKIDDSSSTTTGGYNGGANGSGSYNAGGGGATHIAIRPGMLSSLAKDKNSVIIVAGGGGGGHTDSDYRGYDQKGGNAGGYIGMYAVQIEGSCNSSCTRYNYPSGGTQTSGGIGITSWSSGTTSSTTYVGTFGQGGTGSCYGGGGGGYFGGASGEHSGGGGGSGYIANGNLSNKAMYCYDCEESIADATKTIANGLVSETPQPMYSKIGNGYARITYINE